MFFSNFFYIRALNKILNT
ncbi:hypothetical protein CP8484711_0165A, partial [Chlamydia psittaci 84-8471/1]